MIGPGAIACAAYGKEISLLARIGMTDISHPSRSAIQSQMQWNKSKPVTSIVVHVVVEEVALTWLGISLRRFNDLSIGRGV